jgi:hypothetical protein
MTILVGDCRETLKTLPDQSVHCCITSPPYLGLRDYGVDGQIGREFTPDEFVQTMVEVFREVRRVLRDDGTVWLNLGDSYARNPKKGVRFAGKNGRLNDRQTVEGNCGLPIAAGFEDMVVASAEAVRPPERLTVSQAAEKYHIVNNPGTHVGPFSLERTPYLVEPMDELQSLDFTARFSPARPAAASRSWR